MYLKALSLGALLLPLVAAGSDANATSGPDKDGKYWIYGTGITASFIPYGASISNLFIKDQYGIQRDIVTGFDNASYYAIDRQHPHFGGVPGRYANRIKNSSFEIDGETYHVAANENPTAANPDGVDTLHGGPDGWDWRIFNISSHTQNSITFSIVDPDGKEGFPGEVISYITYSLGNMTWDFKMVAIATTKKTPIMLSSHTYWNLDGFANNETQSALNHTFYLPYSGQRVDVDNILIPTGDILANKLGSVNDFWSAPKQIGHSFSDPELVNNCGNGCTGYGTSPHLDLLTPAGLTIVPMSLPLILYRLDTCYLVNREQHQDWRNDGNFVARMQSAWSGIQLDVYSDQEAFQMYSCNGQNGSMALKTTQGIFDDADFPRTIPKYGCVVLEVEDWIDAINHPEWQRDQRQIYEPGGDPYVLQASYRFSINSTATPY
jgi:aldose 1-epimerase